MNLTDRRLVREIFIVIVVKLALITALWWVFVRDAKVSVDPSAMAAQIVALDNIKPQQTKGEPHAQ